MTQQTNHSQKTTYNILFIIGLVHLLNDSIQAVVPAMFPILEQSHGLTFAQLGFIAFVVNMTSSVMQPVVGAFTDKHPLPYALPMGLGLSLFGMLGLAFAPTYSTILLSVMFIGLGSAAFHPEASRVAHMAAGARKGFGQSVFQVGGNAGQSLAPLITALILFPLGQFGAIWFTIVAFIAVLILLYIAKWYRAQVNFTQSQKKRVVRSVGVSNAIKLALLLLVFLVFIRQFYHASITNFYAFQLMGTFGIEGADAQIYIFVFLAAGALGTFLGGPIADKFGKKNVLLFSMVGAAPLCIALPYANLVISMVLLTVIGFILLSSFSVSVVYAQELLPGKIGMVSGLIIGLSFGLGAIGSVALGWLADRIGLSTTLLYASFLPLIGVLTIWLPNDQKVIELNNPHVEVTATHL